MERSRAKIGSHPALPHSLRRLHTARLRGIHDTMVERFGWKKTPYHPRHHQSWWKIIMVCDCHHPWHRSNCGKSTWYGIPRRRRDLRILPRRWQHWKSIWKSIQSSIQIRLGEADALLHRAVWSSRTCRRWKSASYLLANQKELGLVKPTCPRSQLGADVQAKSFRNLPG